MKLQILVPQYKETDDIIRPLLDSIEIQQNVDLKNDVGVIIVNDSSNVHLSRELLDRYSYRIDYYTHAKKNKGVSATRNACLDYATAEYVMFCDADDMFMNASGMDIIFQEIDKGFDTFVPDFVEEIRVNGKPNFIIHKRDPTFVHGKVHRRQYLIDKNIRWNEKLTLHEDGYFNTLCQRLTEAVVYCSTPFYLWKWRDNSVCRSDSNWVMNTYGHCIDGNEALIDELLKRGKIRDARFLIASFIFTTYILMRQYEWIDQENKEHKALTENRFRNFYFKFKNLYETLPEDYKNKIEQESDIKMRYHGANITFEKWLEQIIIHD